MFAYCANNPVIYKDPNGNFINAIIGGLVGGGVGWLMAKVTGGDATAGAVSGAVGGLISGLGVDLAVATGGFGSLFAPLAGAAGSVAQSIIYRSWTDKSFDIRKLTASDYKSYAISAIIGAAFNTLALGATKALSVNAIKNSSVWRSLINSLRSPLTKNFDENLASLIMTKYLGLKQSVTDYILQQINEGS